MIKQTNKHRLLLLSEKNAAFKLDKKMKQVNWTKNEAV